MKHALKFNSSSFTQLWALLLAATTLGAAPRHSYDSSDLTGEWEGIIAMHGAIQRTFRVTLSIGTESNTPPQPELSPDEQRLQELRKRQEILKKGGTLPSPQIEQGNSLIDPVSLKREQESARKKREDTARRTPQQTNPLEFRGTIRFEALHADTQRARDDSQGEVRILGSIDPDSGEFKIIHTQDYIKRPRNMRHTGYGRANLTGLVNPAGPTLFGWAGATTGQYISPLILAPKGVYEAAFYDRFDAIKHANMEEGQVADMRAIKDQAYQDFQAERKRINDEYEQRRDAIEAEKDAYNDSLKEDPEGLQLDLPVVQSTPPRVRGRSNRSTVLEINQDLPALKQLEQWKALTTQQIEAWKFSEDSYNAEKKQYADLKYKAEQARTAESYKTESADLREAYNARRAALREKKDALNDTLRNDPSGASLDLPPSTETNQKTRITAWYNAAYAELQAWNKAERAAISERRSNALKESKEAIAEASKAYYAAYTSISGEAVRLQNECRAKYSDYTKVLREDPSGDSLTLTELTLPPLTVRDPDIQSATALLEKQQDPRTRIRNWHKRALNEQREWYESALEEAARQKEVRMAETHAPSAPSITIDRNKITTWAQSLNDEKPELLNQSYYLNKLGGVVHYLLRDEIFEPTFGVKFDELNATDRDLLYYGFELRTHPKTAYNMGLPEVPFREANHTLSPMVQKHYLYHIGVLELNRQLLAWKNKLQAELSQLSPEIHSFRYLLEAEAAAARTLSQFRQSEQDEVTLAFDKARFRLADQVALMRVQAAVAQADQQNSIYQLNYFWARQHDLHEFLSESGVDKVNETLNTKLDQMVVKIVWDLERMLSDMGSGLKAVRIGSDWYQQLRAELGASLSRPSAQRAIRALSKRRPKDFQKALPEIHKAFQATKNNEAVEDLLTSLLSVPGDKVLDVADEIRGMAYKQMIQNNREAYQAKFSEREVQLMDEKLRIQVPANYPKPTPEEARLALLRAMASTGGKVLDKTSARMAVGGLGKYDLYAKMTFMQFDVLSIEKDRVKGYNVHIRYRLRMEAEGNFKGLLGGGPGTFHGNLGELLTGLMEIEEVEGLFRMTLTQQGWQCPEFARAMNATRLDVLFKGL